MGRGRTPIPKEAEAVSISRQELAERAASLAAQGVYIGTSSWKYPGWCGMIYDRARYEYRGKFAETRFKRDCLAEYAEVFKAWGDEIQNRV
jgi:hypothetical protein